MYNLDLVTIVIIAVNVIISFKGFEDRSFFERYKFNIGRIRQGEQLRMVSSGFLHADTKHLVFNMLTLFFFADTVIRTLGAFNFVTIYLASLIFGNLLTLYFHKDDYWYSAIGASGAVTGVLYAAILIAPDMRINFIPGYLFGIGYLLYSIYGMKNRIGNIGHDAHFGGAVGGYAVTLLLMPSLFKTDLVHIGLLAIPIVILFILHKMGKLS